MSEPQVQETEFEMPEGVGEVNEIHLPGDEEKIAAAAQEVAAEPETPAGPAASASEPVAEADGEEEAPTSSLEALRQRYASETGEAATPETAPDPRDQALAEAQAEVRRQLEARIEDMKAAQGRTEPEKTEAPDAAASRKERLQTAAKMLADRWGREDLTVEEQTSDLMATVGELFEIERETWEQTKLAPIQERIEAENRAKAQQAEVEAVATETRTGLQALREKGGTAKELADEFFEANRSGKGWEAVASTYLGRALLSGWDHQNQALPPNLRSRQVVEAMGIALAAEIDDMLRGDGGNGSVGGSDPSAPSGIVPKARRSKGAKPTGAEAAAEQLLEETLGEMGSAYHKLGHADLDWRGGKGA